MKFLISSCQLFRYNSIPRNKEKEKEQNLSKEIKMKKLRKK